MRNETKNRQIYWWIWPDFYSEKDARDMSKAGVFCCAWMAALIGISGIINYSGNGNTGLLIFGIVDVFIYSLLGYGILKMSRVAVSAALIYFIVEIIWSFIERGKIGLAPIFTWYFIQSNRAIYWYRGGMVKPEIKPQGFLICLYCKTQYSTKSFNRGTAEWLCPTCNKAFPKII